MGGSQICLIMKTYAERLKLGLVAKGWREDKTDRSRYTAFVREGTQGKVFVGPSGALRAGVCASKSHSVGSPVFQSAIYREYLLAADNAVNA